MKGSLIKTIDSIHVAHRTPAQVALILSYSRPPFEITFRVFVTFLFRMEENNSEKYFLKVFSPFV